MNKDSITPIWSVSIICTDCDVGSNFEFPWITHLTNEKLVFIFFCYYRNAPSKCTLITFDIDTGTNTNIKSVEYEHNNKDFT